MKVDTNVDVDMNSYKYRIKYTQQKKVSLLRNNYREKRREHKKGES